MKRIKQACLCQTLHFMLKDGIPHDEAVVLVAYEVRRYKESLIRHHIRHKLLEEQTLPDGSMIIKLIKQYNQSPVGDYLD